MFHPTIILRNPARLSGYVGVHPALYFSYEGASVNVSLCKLRIGSIVVNIVELKLIFCYILELLLVISSADLPWHLTPRN